MIAALVIAIPVVLVILLWTGFADPYLRDLVIREVGNATGGRVELRGIHLNAGTLHVDARRFHHPRARTCRFAAVCPRRPSRRWPAYRFVLGT